MVEEPKQSLKEYWGRRPTFNVSSVEELSKLEKIADEFFKYVSRGGSMANPSYVGDIVIKNPEYPEIVLTCDFKDLEIISHDEKLKALNLFRSLKLGKNKITTTAVLPTGQWVRLVLISS